MRKIVLIVLGLFVVFTAVSQVFSFTGTVVKMMDADIMTIRDDRGIEFVIHLKGVDCPDSGQAFYNDAREMVESYCKDKKLTVLCDSSDLYGRTFAEVKLPDGRSLSKELLRFGYAWHYKRYNKEPEMAQIESDARTMRRGLWQYDNPVPPWVFRRDDTVKVAEYKGTIANTPDLPKERKPTMFLNLHPNNEQRMYKERTVFICTDGDDEHFHRINYCKILTNSCGNSMDITPIVQEQAVDDYDKTPCKKCW